MSASRVTGFGVLWLVVAGCAKAPPQPTDTRSLDAAPATATTSAPLTASRDAPAGAELLPIPDAVARLHRNAFSSAAVDPKLGGVRCFVTLHDAGLERGEFFPLVLFEDGAVATWRQTATGKEEPFFATLSSDEQARATQLVEALKGVRGAARATFARSTLVMGVSLRVSTEVQTLYFDQREVPAPLNLLVALLKQRLEATNRAP